MRSKFLIRYDYKKAYKAGVKGTVTSDLDKLGYEVIRIEHLHKYYCSLVEVRSLKVNPDYIDELSPLWVFG